MGVYVQLLARLTQSRTYRNKLQAASQYKLARPGEVRKGESSRVEAASNVQECYKNARPTPIGEQAEGKGKHFKDQRVCSTERELLQ